MDVKSAFLNGTFDDLIFTGSNLRMFEEFKERMIEKFEMTDLGLMSCYLGIEVRAE